jgi:hypothetical protein
MGMFGILVRRGKTLIIVEVEVIVGQSQRSSTSGLLTRLSRVKCKYSNVQIDSEVGSPFVFFYC